MRRALFFDVDGTLFDMRAGLDHVPAAVRAEISRVQAQGHLAFVSSGRPWPMIDERILSVGFDGYVLANGGNVRLGDEVIYEERMGAHLARATEEVLRDEGVEHVLDTADEVLIDRTFRAMPDFIYACATELARDAFPPDVHERTIKLECFPTPQVRTRLVERLERELGDAIFVDDNGAGAAFELYSPRLSKATGIRCMLDHFGLDAENAICFGDGANDLPMFAACGTAVAMGNASERVKAAADLVCGCAADGGLARAIAELV